MKKAIIFDLDGTLVNSLPDISAAMNRSLEAFGLPTYPEREYQYKVGNGVIKLSERSVGERRDQLENVMNAYMADYRKNSMVDTRPYTGIPEMLGALKESGLKVCVLSNKDQEDVENVLKFCFPDFVFDVQRGRVENVPLKPDPKGAVMIADELGLVPEECWYAGDTSMDMNCGNSAGMETIGVLWGFRPMEELVQSNARHLAAVPDEVVTLIKNS